MVEKTVWETIEECAKEWKMVEIYYRRKKDEMNIRYELLPISKRGNLIYLYDPVKDETKRFIESRIKRAKKIESCEPPITKQEAPYPVEIGAEEEEFGKDMPSV